MNWIIARLREDSTRSGIGQLAVIVLLGAMLAGVDVQGLVTQAQASLDSIVATIAGAAGAWAALSRILTPQQPPTLPVLPPEAVEGLKRLGAALSDRDAPQ